MYLDRQVRALWAAVAVLSCLIAMLALRDRPEPCCCAPVYTLHAEVPAPKYNPLGSGVYGAGNGHGSQDAASFN